MTFDEALAALDTGAMVRRASWPAGRLVLLGRRATPTTTTRDRLLLLDGFPRPWTADEHDETAADWETGAP